MRKHFWAGVGAAVVSAALVIAGPAMAEGVKLDADRDSVLVKHEGRMVEITRNQDPDHLVDPMWAKTSRPCPPFCIEPMVVVEGVGGIEEVELFNFMVEKVNRDTGVIIDARLADWYERGTIPGSINIPFTVFQRETGDPMLVKALTFLGAKPRGEVGTFERLVDNWFGSGDKSEQWDFSAAKEVVLWCNGPWCGQSPHAIRALAKLGYPLNRMHYYRGGMQMWQILGLTTVVPDPKNMLFADVRGGE